ncbi:MAG: hypothetical protein QG594_314 [Bacteroidota bacterium]|nr:hypothetical protein [Bacteroidota bacterium]
MFKKVFVASFLLICTLSQAQVGGQNVFQFVNLVASPRQAALGGKNITIYDNDVNQGIFNPASINNEMHNNLAVNYGSYFGEITYGTAAFAHNFKKMNTLHAGVNYVNYGDFDGYDGNRNPTGNFTGSAIALSAGWAYQVPKTNLHLGASGKFISSSLEAYSSTGGSIDLGAIYVNKKNNINWALVIRNIGTQFTTYSGIKEDIPTEIIFGFSKELAHVPIRWHVNLENLQQWDVSFSNPSRSSKSLDGTSTEEKVSFANNALRHVIFGVEFLPRRAFNIRLSYNFRRAEELKILQQSSFSGLSLGFGLKMNHLKFNYSYSSYTLAANTSLFGLTINFQ